MNKKQFVSQVLIWGIILVVALGGIFLTFAQEPGGIFHQGPHSAVSVIKLTEPEEPEPKAGKKEDKLPHEEKHAAEHEPADPLQPKQPKEGPAADSKPQPGKKSEAAQPNPQISEPLPGPAEEAGVNPPDPAQQSEGALSDPAQQPEANISTPDEVPPTPEVIPQQDGSQSLPESTLDPAASSSPTGL